MSLSDEILANRGNLVRIRHLLSALSSDVGATSAFLIDESGIPFAAVGNVEFRFPHPIPRAGGGQSNDAILEALLGIEREDESSSLLLFTASPRALLVTILEDPLSGKKRREAMARLKRVAGKIKPLLEIPPAPTR